MEALIREVEASTDDEHFTRYARKFIVSVYNEAKNPILVEIINLLLGRMGAYFRLALGTYHKKYRNDQIEAFRGFLDAMVHHDPDKMQKLADETLNRLASQLEVAFEHYRNKD